MWCLSTRNQLTADREGLETETRRPNITLNIREYALEFDTDNDAMKARQRGLRTLRAKPMMEVLQQYRTVYRM